MSIVRKIDAGITLEDSKKYIGDNFISRLPLFKYEKTKLPENNVCLFIDLLSDGTGDFGWAKEYIDLLKEYGYTKDKIFVFGFASNVFNESGSLSDEFKDLENTIKDTLRAVLDLKSTDDKKVFLQSILDKFDNICDFFSNIKVIESSKISIFIGDFIKHNEEILKTINRNLPEIIGELEDKILTYKTFCDDVSTNSHPICNMAVPKFTQNLNILKNRIFTFTSRVLNNITNFQDANFYYASLEYIESLSWIEENNDVIQCDDKDLDKILENSIVLYFSAGLTLSGMLPFDPTPGKINLRKCKKIKSFIILQEGGLGEDRSRDTLRLALSSGIGIRQMGLNFQDIVELSEKEDIIEILKTNVHPDFKEFLNKDTKYHYAYIGQLDMTRKDKTVEQICKFLYDQVLLINLIDDNSVDNPNFLFGLESVIQYIKSFKIYCELRSKLDIDDIAGDDQKKITNLIHSFFFKYNILVEDFKFDKFTYKLTSNDKKKHLIVSYFPRLDKTKFLSMVKNSTSPVFSTGDLSTHEALVLGKYVIADYIENKKPMIDLFIRTLNKFCNSKIHGSTLPDENNIDFYKKIKNNQYKFTIYDINSSVKSFKIHISNYDLFKTEVLDKYFIYRDNFKVLLYLANNCVRKDKNTLYLPTQYSAQSPEKSGIPIYENPDSIIIDEMNNEPELIEFLDGLLGGKNNYYLKYQKYKLKYLKLKNTYKIK